MSAAATPADVLAGTARWCVVEGDCADVLRSLAAGSVVVVTDPPYDARTHAGYKTCNGNDPKRVKIPFPPIDPAAVVPELLRVSSSWVVAFCALEQLGAYQAAGGKHWVRAGIWHRPRAAPMFTGDRPAQAADGVAILHARRGGRMTWNGGGSHAFWSVGHQPDEEGAQRGHPNRKPVVLMRELIRLFTSADDVVFDGYAGSGTTGVAALAEGRRVILVERDPIGAALAVARCAAVANGADWRAPATQGQLFAAVGS